ncbi:hypothetical protein ECFRIK1990_3070, partial [Escherichia coli FRIK1990]
MVAFIFGINNRINT